MYDGLHQHELPSPSITSPLFSQQVPYPSEANLYATGEGATFDELAGIGEGTSDDQHNGDRQPFSIHEPYHEFPGFGEPAFAAAMDELMLPFDSAMRTSVWPETNVDHCGTTDEPVAQTAVPGWMGQDHSAARRVSFVEKSEVVRPKQPDGEYKCPECSKMKTRECDLR